MKTIIPLCLLILFFSGCAVAPQSDFYAERNNWVLCDSGNPDAEYDVFYIYPTLEGKAKTPEMEWLNNPDLQKKISGFTQAQTYGVLGKNIRAFAPYVHQLTYQSVWDIMSKRPLSKAEWKHFERGMKETVAAFQYYLRHYNQGRPYILLGHSQGSMDLYYLIEHCPEIKKENGFVAAYLIGLPHAKTAEIKRDFGSRVKVAQNADGLGVIAVWNTQNAEANASFMAGKGCYCINPLNWRTDSVPAGSEMHLLAYFYDYRDGSVKTQKGMFGAQVDPERGVLIVDLPSNSVWDAKGFMGKGIFHMNDVWFFAGNLRANAEHRVRLWKKEYKK
ncbi:MAG: DUF3089 domain-containing protein [Lentisphaeria bacterium]|nr:DUF3089 domain-containing protein [Lentisphaeria bacterium]